MRSAFLDEAQPEAISHAVRHVLEQRGALVTEHRHSRVRFAGLQAGPRLSWSRAGYVGIYQHQGEQEAEVRLQLRARWPWRILWTIALVNVVVFLATAITNPSGTTWSVLAILTGGLLLAAGLVYVATLKSVREQERSLMAELEEAFSRGMADARVETEEERELRELEAELEGEIAARRIQAARPPRAKGSRFRLRPDRQADEAAGETPEEKRARLLARKAELEARRRDEP